MLKTAGVSGNSLTQKLTTGFRRDYDSVGC